MPMSIKVEGSHFLIVGGGRIALKKVKKLLHFNVRITLVSPVVDQAMDPVLQHVMWQTSRYDKECLQEVDYVIAATNDKKLNGQIQIDCKNKEIPCLNVSDGRSSDFQIPALVIKDPVHISVSTQGLSPGMAKELRRSIEQWLDDEWVERTIEMAELRRLIKEHVETQKERESILREMTHLPLSDLKLRRQQYENQNRNPRE